MGTITLLEHMPLKELMWYGGITPPWKGRIQSQRGRPLLQWPGGKRMTGNNPNKIGWHKNLERAKFSLNTHWICIKRLISFGRTLKLGQRFIINMSISSVALSSLWSVQSQRARQCVCVCVCVSLTMLEVWDWDQSLQCRAERKTSEVSMKQEKRIF